MTAAAPEAVRRVSPDADTPAPVRALTQLLDDLTAVLIELPVDAYVARPAGRVSGSIWGHVRHTLDHVAAWLSASPSRVLAYDHRERGTAVETDPSAAVRLILHLKAGLAERASDDLSVPLLVTSAVTTDGASVTGWSTLARELAFVISHTIHHHALVALLLERQGYAPPDRFGYAPSTPRE